MTDQKRNVYVILGILEEYMDLDEMIDIITQAKERATSENITDVKLEISKEKGYYGDVDVTLRIEGRRFETTEEVAIRLAAEQHEKSARIKRLERELQELRKSK